MKCVSFQKQRYRFQFSFTICLTFIDNDLTFQLFEFPTSSGASERLKKTKVVQLSVFRFFLFVFHSFIDECLTFQISKQISSFAFLATLGMIYARSFWENRHLPRMKKGSRRRILSRSERLKLKCHLYRLLLICTLLTPKSPRAYELYKREDTCIHIQYNIIIQKNYK